MKDKMTGKQKGKQNANKKSKADSKKNNEKPNKGKRKSDGSPEDTEVKRKKDADMEVDTPEGEADSGGGVKRSHDEDGESKFFLFTVLYYEGRKNGCN